MCLLRIMLIFFFNDTATTEIYTLSLHDALPISKIDPLQHPPRIDPELQPGPQGCRDGARSEEHTSELQSQSNLVCRLLLEKKKTNNSSPLTHVPSCHRGLSRMRTYRSHGSLCIL